MKSADIRKAFLDYFEKNDHRVLPSSSLVPGKDPTLLFTNAGMVQFKEVFLGQDKPVHPCAATSQRCVRAGGKHNDLDNVGYTARHHTFFEMLGNFSFGDYFKKEAIAFAWSFLIEELKIPADKLWVTVYKDDDEAYDIWLKDVGVAKERIIRCGEKDNFWSMGDVGPCGPCTEIFYDHGPDVAGGPPGSPDEDGDRYVEVWNLVFMQYNRQTDGTMEPLPKPSVDTGMGLERISAVLQGVHSNYDIDLFQALINAAADVLSVKDKSDIALKVIADHIRSSAFLIIDGVVPGNEGRSYVLRRIMRRAIRYGYVLGADKPFMHALVGTLAKEMGDAYPALRDSQDYIETVILKEEEQFLRTLAIGMSLLKDEKTDVLNGETAFKLYDTYGFPIDLTEMIGEEQGFTVDRAAYEKCMKEQKVRSREGGQFSTQAMLKNDFKTDICTIFLGYSTLEATGEVRLLLDEDGNEVDALRNQSGIVILGETPFYAENGGQVGDTGVLRIGDNLAQVTQTVKMCDAFAHLVNVTGELKLADMVEASVDPDHRMLTMNNHSATHLLNAALRKVLGIHVLQKGSLVDAKRLRFDFSHHAPLTAEEKEKIEALVNDAIEADYEVKTELMTPEKAKAEGALSLVGEKYADEVRVLTMGDFSKELCGGTHVPQTGVIQKFKIKSESGVAAGIRRIEAVTANAVDAFLLEQAEQQAALQTQKEKREKKKQRAKEKAASAAQAGMALVDSAVDIDGIFVLAETLPGADGKSLRDSLDQIRNKLQSAVVVLATVNDGKIQLIAGVTKDCTSKMKAGDLVNFVASQVGGKGGGRPDMAQAGGSDVNALSQALASVEAWVRERL